MGLCHQTKEGFTPSHSWSNGHEGLHQRGFGIRLYPSIYLPCRVYFFLCPKEGWHSEAVHWLSNIEQCDSEIFEITLKMLRGATVNQPPQRLYLIRIWMGWRVEDSFGNTNGALQVPRYAVWPDQRLLRIPELYEWDVPGLPLVLCPGVHWQHPDLLPEPDRISSAHVPGVRTSGEVPVVPQGRKKLVPSEPHPVSGIQLQPSGNPDRWGEVRSSQVLASSKASQEPTKIARLRKLLTKVHSKVQHDCHPFDCSTKEGSKESHLDAWSLPQLCLSQCRLHLLVLVKPGSGLHHRPPWIQNWYLCVGGSWQIRFSKACRLFTLKQLPTTMETIKLLFHHVFRSFGLPDNIVSDRGPQNISQVWRNFLLLLGMTVSLSSGYHPQTSGQSERKIHEIGRFLRTYCLANQQERVPVCTLLPTNRVSLVRGNTGVSSCFP